MNTSAPNQAAHAQSLVLYVRPTCTWCLRVMTYAIEHDLDLPTLDVSSDPLALEELVRVGGKPQVPCLFIDGEPLYESASIIAWLGEHVVGV